MARILKLTLAILIWVVTLGQFVQIAARDLFDLPLLGADELLVFPVLWLFFLGAANASRGNTHIRAHILARFLTSVRQTAILSLVGEVVTLMVAAWLTYWAWELAAYSLHSGKVTPIFHLPTVVADLSLVVGLGAMVIFSLHHMMRHLRAVAGKRSRRDG